MTGIDVHAIIIPAPYFNNCRCLQETYRILALYKQVQLYNNIMQHFKDTLAFLIRPVQLTEWQKNTHYIPPSIVLPIQHVGYNCDNFHP